MEKPLEEMALIDWLSTLVDKGVEVSFKKDAGGCVIAMIMWDYENQLGREEVSSTGEEPTEQAYTDALERLSYNV